MIKRTFLYLGIITLVLYSLRYLHYKGLLRHKTGYYGKYKQAFLEKNDFNFLFLGSSRAEMHYDTRVFDSLTGFNSFNLSLKGASPHLALAALKAYLFNNSAPEYVVYEVDYHALKDEPVPFYEFNNYFPFLRNTALRREFQKIDKRTILFYTLPYASFPFTGYKNISTSLHGWLNNTESDRERYLYYKGTIASKNIDTLSYRPSDTYSSFIQVNNRNYIDSIVALCKQKRIRLVFCTSPAFGGFRVSLRNKDELATQVKNIATIHGLPYYDFSQTIYCNNRKLFVDFFHLNPCGAILFTREFAGLFNNKMSAKPLK